VLTVAITLRGGATSPDPYLVGLHLPDQPLNMAGVNEGVDRGGSGHQHR
jgi:hypothetical protein